MAVAPYHVVLGIVVVLSAFGLGRYTGDDCALLIDGAKAVLQEQNLKLIRAVQNQDDVAASADKALIKKLKEERDALSSKISAGVALNTSDVNVLRKFFTDTDRNSAGGKGRNQGAAPSRLPSPRPQ